MKMINIKELPVIAKVFWGLSLVMVLIGAALLLLDMFEVVAIRTWIPLTFIDASCLINVFFLFKYRKNANG